MKVYEYAKYAWFSDLAYVEWDDVNIFNPIKAASDKNIERIPLKLGEKIFLENKGALTD